jgi:hypothetical protein
MTSMTDIIYRNQKTYQSFVLKVCKEELSTVNVVMYFPKNFYLKTAIDKKLNQLATAGLLEFWIQNFADMRFYHLKAQQSGPKNLEIQHLLGIFNIWLIGCAVAGIVLIIELIFDKVSRKLNYV